VDIFNSELFNIYIMNLHIVSGLFWSRSHF